MQSVSIQTLQRLPLYLNYLRALSRDKNKNISATTIAVALDLGEVQVRKDLASVSEKGKPKVGYVVEDLIADLENFLGYNNVNNAVIVGAGKLGKALLSYSGFTNYGLDIIAAFDLDKKVANTKFSKNPIFPIENFKNICLRLKVNIGIITVPSHEAQNVCDLMVNSGIKAIWNFAPIHLSVPNGILVQDENMASSLAMLSNHLNDTIDNISN